MASAIQPPLLPSLSGLCGESEPGWEVYNRQVEEIIGMEQRGELFVVRPNGPLPIRRVEKDPAKLQAVYDLGAEAGRASLSGLKEYLLTHE